MSLLLRGGRVLTSLSPSLVADADVLIEEGRIAAVGETGLDGAAQIDCSGCLVIPGNVCAHTHVYSALARGMPFHLDGPENFLQILQRVWWRLDRALDEDSVRASAEVGAMEALLAGTTTLVDHHASPNAIDGSLDVIAQAFARLGLRSILCYEVTDRDGPERAKAGVRENLRFAKHAQGGGMARGMIGAHASFTLSDETLEACVGAARDAGVGIHVHVAEDEADEVDAEARFGTRVAMRLARAGALGDDTLLAHCVHLDAQECRLVRRSGATVAHNPRSNMNNAVGRTPLAALSSVALGTDGIGSDMFEESRAGFFRLREDTLGAPPDWPLCHLAEGARFAGRVFGEPLLGTLAPGAPADVVVLDYEAPAPLDGGNVAGHWVFGLGSRAVRDVIVAGEVVVRDRRLTCADQCELSRAAAVDAKRMWERLDDIGPHPFEPRS